MGGGLSAFVHEKIIFKIIVYVSKMRGIFIVQATITTKFYKIREMNIMENTIKKKLAAMGMIATLTLGGLTACGDGVDQDNGVSDGEKQDELDADEDGDEE